jgi:hypothetical protein
MAHYALLDENDIVVQVITGHDEDIDGVDWEAFYSQETGLACKRTSYWTKGGVHRTESGEPSANQSKAFRKNYAGIGFTYDFARDAFIPPPPYPSWILDEETCLWEAPEPRPSIECTWNEKMVSWDCP